MSSKAKSYCSPKTRKKGYNIYLIRKNYKKETNLLNFLTLSSKKYLQIC